MQGRSTDGADCPGSGRGERGEGVYRALPPYRPTARRSVVEGGTASVMLP